MMMSLGMFLFSLPTVVYQNLEHRRDVRFAQNERFGTNDAWQFIGPGGESITLNGVTAYGINHASSSMAILNRMMQSGEAFPLIDGLGNMFGEYILLSLDQKKTVFRKFGQARRTEWSLGLQRVDDPGGSIGNAILDKLLDAAGNPQNDIADLAGKKLSVFGKGFGL